MEITLTLKDLGFILVIVAVLILIYYLVGLLKNLIITAKHTNAILEDTSKVTAIAARRAEQVDEAVGDLAESVKDVADMLKGNRSIMAAGSTLINAVAALKNLLAKK